MSAFPVEIRDEAPIRGRVGSTVFATRIVRGVDPARPTPAWMIARLKLAGIRSISLLVDITNYVMLELGQPIHGYDLDALRGGIVVRRAAPGETIVTLDGKERALHPEDLLITDDRGAIGIAGVMGGAETEISDSTRNVLIESANFDPVSIARSARRHKLPSEASRRYERGVDPQIAGAAASRVAQLMVDLAGGTADDGGSLIHEAPSREAIVLPRGFVSSLIGVEYTEAEVHDALAEVGGAVTVVEDGFSVGAARRGAPISRVEKSSPKRWPGSSATTASPRCFRSLLPDEGSPDRSDSAARRPTCSPVPARPRC